MDENEIKNAIIQQRLQEENMQRQLKIAMEKILDKKSMERLSNLKLVKPDLALSLELYLFQLYQAGHIKKITEQQMIEILKKISAKREIKIRRK